MAVLILVSVPLGASRSLGKLAGEVEDVWYTGTGKADVSLDECLTERVTYARNLLTIAGRYPTVAKEEVKALESAITVLEESPTPSWKYDANTQLEEAASNLYSALELWFTASSDTSVIQDMKLLKEAYADFKSVNSQMGHADYNEKAQEYNRVFKSSPLSGISGQEEAELFQ